MSASTGVKPNAETFKFLVRFTDVLGLKDKAATSVAKAAGISYYAAWTGMTKARKDLAAEGYVPESQAAAGEAQDTTPRKTGATKGGRKRKASDGEEGADDADVKAETPKKRVRPAKGKKQVKSEEDQDDDVKIKGEEIDGGNRESSETDADEGAVKEE